MILGGAPEHGRAADVDVLDGFLHCDVRPGHRLLERIKIHHDQVNRLDPVFFHLRLVAGIAAQIEQTAVNLRMQRLHATGEHFRESGVIAQFDDGQAGLPQSPGGAAGGNQFHFRRDQRLRQRDEPGLIVNRDECAPNLCHNSRLNSSRNFGRVNAKSTRGVKIFCATR